MRASGYSSDANVLKQGSRPLHFHGKCRQLPNESWRLDAVAGNINARVLIRDQSYPKLLGDVHLASETYSYKTLS